MVQDPQTPTVQEPPPPEIPAAQVFLESVPEKILIKGKEYTLRVKILNITDANIDVFIKYRINGFKILSVSHPAGSGQKVSIEPLSSIMYDINFTPEIEGPLQLEIELRGWKKLWDPVEREYEVEYEVEVEYDVPYEVQYEVEVEVPIPPEELPPVPPTEDGIPAPQIPRTRIEKQIRTRTEIRKEKRVEKRIRIEKRLEYEVRFEEFALHQTAGYMEAVISGIEELDTFITQGDVSTEIVTDIGAALNSIIFYFPNNQLPHDANLLRSINKEMFQKTGKNFLYLNYAISNEFTQKEQKIIKQGIDKFLPRLDKSKRLLILNLDFLPKMMKPTIVIGASPRSFSLQNTLASTFDDQLDIIVDGDVFAGGNIYEVIQQLTSNHEADIVNIALSADFIENHDLFIKMIDPFVQ
ncbi:MAG: hypothetical protein ACTSRW_07280 [Candidatus Helarchaeota archaeon]